MRVADFFFLLISNSRYANAMRSFSFDMLYGWEDVRYQCRKRARRAHQKDFVKQIWCNWTLNYA